MKLKANAMPLALALLLPILIANLVTFLWPMLNLAALSFRAALPGGGIGAISLSNWASLLTDRYYAGMAAESIGVAALVTLLALLCSYPLALFVHRATPRWRNLLVVVCISPLLVSAVVRTYGWLIILGDQGMLAGLLRWLGVSRPPRMVYNLTGVLIGLVEIIMPYMILSLLAGFGRLNPALEEAARSLGAAPRQVFWRIVLPLSLPGVVLGCMFAFVLTLSSFITPKLLGGGRVILLATEIYDQAIVTLNWPLASALSLCILVLFALTLLAYSRVARAVA